jgi:hypothetical protein
MNYIWNYEGIKVGSITTNRWEVSQMWTSGFGIREYVNGFDVFQWEATALQNGWYIVITKSTGKIGEFQGSTFNLPLEISAAARRLL